VAAPRLRKQLGLFDVYAISTGAMFSSGFFLLPGIAAASAGPSVALAYGAASVFIIPAMLSVAELATAMPKAGGAYYFLDRSMGPMVGTVGGLGTWIALVLKSAFALVGMGAYLALFVDVPIEPLAVGLTILFMIVNVIGAKETSGLQRWLVSALLVILAFFIVQGLVEIAGRDVAQTRDRFTPFMPFGALGFFSTIGLVFVSYAGLTKVASVAEEVRQPERNIPLGMFLSLATATFIYVVGVAIIVAVLEPSELHRDLTPVATAARAFFDWLPSPVGLVLIVIAAIAAFASTGNAGILSASRYPLAMARDRLIWGRFAEVGRFGTPTLAIVVTAGGMAACILLLDIEGIAKLASAFQLLLFAMLNLAVIIMRESRIEAYLPQFRSPAYPWVQIFGMVGPLWLITEMGELAVLFTLALVAVCIAWYFHYARGRVPREGAIYHTFARLGRLRYEGLDLELRTIVQEQGLRTEDPFDEIVARAPAIDAGPELDFRAICDAASRRLAERTGLDELEILAGYIAELEAGVIPVARGAAIPHLRAPGVEQPEMVLVRSKAGVRVVARTSDPGLLAESGAEPAAPENPHVHAIFFILSPEDRPGQHLRLLGHLATHVDDDTFLPSWLEAPDGHALRESLLREERSISFLLRPDRATCDLIGRRVMDLRLPSGTLIVYIRRGTETVVPHGMTVLNEGDRVTIIGEPHGIRELTRRYGGAGTGPGD
jgi:APA family basic amino acid/polyamine antiporter